MNETLTRGKALFDVTCPQCRKPVDYSVLRAVDEAAAEQLSIRAAGMSE